MTESIPHNSISSKWFLASDMDGTVIPLEMTRQSENAIRQFRLLIETHPNIHLAYITGRHLELGLEGVRQYGLPMPHTFVCDVGTSIYHRNQDTFCLDHEYRQKLLNAWHGNTGRDIARILADLDGIIEQEVERQKDFKQSYYATLANNSGDLCQSITQLLAARDIPASVIYSMDTQKNIGLVDILPPGTAKHTALHYLVQQTGIDTTQAVYAGDSGNDYHAFIAGYKAIVVGNTDLVTRTAVRQITLGNGNAELIYYAHRPSTAGVLEGCRHFGLFPQ